MWCRNHLRRWSVQGRTRKKRHFQEFERLKIYVNRIRLKFNHASEPVDIRFEEMLFSTFALILVMLRLNFYTVVLCFKWSCELLRHSPLSKVSWNSKTNFFWTLSIVLYPVQVACPARMSALFSVSLINPEQLDEAPGADFFSLPRTFSKSSRSPCRLRNLVSHNVYFLIFYSLFREGRFICLENRRHNI